MFSAPGRSGFNSTLNNDAAYMIVELKVQGRALHLLVDTGLQTIVLFEDRVRKRIPKFKVEDETDEFMFAGRVPAREVTLRNAQLGTTRDNLKVLLAKSPPDNILPSLDGFLGTPALKARRIDINFLSQTLAWKK